MTKLPKAVAATAAVASLCACGVAAGVTQTESRLARALPSQERRAHPDPQPTTLSSLTPAERRAFERWIIGLYLHRWLAGIYYDPLQCDGDLPPCYVMRRESGGDPTAENPISTASGKWQFLDSTWNNYGGYAHAAWAPVQVQDAKAREVWAGGAGASHWACC